MGVSYELGESLRIDLDIADLKSLTLPGYTTYRKGLAGHRSKTWVRQKNTSEALHASIVVAIFGSVILLAIMRTFVRG
jgi:hypothetical protein